MVGLIQTWFHDWQIEQRLVATFPGYADLHLVIDQLAISARYPEP